MSNEKRISRSKLESLFKCRLCGYLEIRHEVKQPSIPFAINMAVDVLLKKDFDQYRETGQVPPVLAKLGKNFVPFQDSRLETWRDSKLGIQRQDPVTGITVYGAIDDIWTLDGQIVVVDYKSTARYAPVKELGTESYHDSYRRQLDFYAWLLNGNGLITSETGYLFYVTGRKGAAGFMGRLEFDPTLIEHKIDTSWIEPFLKEANSVLAGPPPSGAEDCNWCQYRATVSSILSAGSNG
jgi:hypothetical protein